ncbi:bacterio-opsin activator domain-containing protein [Natronosalvus vescus]|uniref:helix-turn-helix domain-containing protein n=1 Tax=Natronosalvus vescus TaxID=2953881 RepID=UPI00209060A9|nr:helix-turn-helix domain-containing protein [Natronosalvus vescus]
MSVILEFTVDNEQFLLGRVLSGAPPMQIQLERIVPTGDTVIPFLWATGDDFETFERTVFDHPHVEDFVAIDNVENSTLYRGVWVDNHDNLIQGIGDVDGTILEGRSADGQWEFHLRLLDHDKLSQFYNYCSDHGISIHIVRTFTLTERTESVKQFDLSEEQREALILGLREGYFDTPSRVDLDELADELGISQQALSNRIRRGTQSVLTEALLSSPDTD